MLTIIWSESALEDVSANIEYLENVWTEKEIIRFTNKMEEVLDKLSKGNIEFKSTDYKNIFQVVILKQITLFYQVDKNNIILLRFWNNYQNPDNLTL